MDMNVVALEDMIMSNIMIPYHLRGNLYFTKTRLGGLFLIYSSRGNIPNVESSNTLVIFRLIASDNFGRFQGPYVRLEVKSKGLRGLNNRTTPQHFLKVCGSINNWIINNERVMMKKREVR